MPLWPLLGGIFGLLLLTVWVWFVITSCREREDRAAGRAFLILILMVAVPGGVLLLRPEILPSLLTAILILTALGLLAGLLLSRRPRLQQDPAAGPLQRIDERDVLFARFDLEKGSQRYHEYYARRPEYRERDEQIRSLPDILTSSHSSRAPWLFALADAEFDLLEHLMDKVNGPTSPDRMDAGPSQNSRRLKQIISYLGADDCGICEIDPSYLYSHVGRGPEPYGREIRQEHRFAVVFTFPMDFGVISTAPQAPVIVETGKHYLAAARTAVVAAGMIRRLGYSARAHMAGSSYQAALPPLAWRAGLGEIGRMGILITPRHGPRVRLGLVTTNLPLVQDRPRSFGVLDFCVQCRKCAYNCPSQAIPLGARSKHNGSLRWVIDREACYEYWRKVGTDCARCIYVCPYSKPDTPLHTAVRWTAARSRAAQALFIKADDWFYGRHPKPHRSPFSY